MVSQEIFARYLTARPQEDHESILEDLLVNCAQATVTRAVHNSLRALYTAADAAELGNEAMLELLKRLRALREEGRAADTIRFDAFAAGVAANTVHRFYARRFPERNRLRKRLRYALETGEATRIRRGRDGATICALARAAPDDPLADSADVERCLHRMRQRPFPAHPVGPMATAILRSLEKPIELSRLTAIATELLGLREPSFAAPAPEWVEALSETVQDPLPSVALRFEMRERLEKLWPEVLSLPRPQKIALLFSARASSGSVLWLLVDLGVTSFRLAAAALEITAEILAEIWNRLPLEDTEIAGMLALERQQVINLRAAARQRLARREKKMNSAASLPIRGAGSA